jgi:cbb3-type cytochrome oxidase cytochrome c subunit
MNEFIEKNLGAMLALILVAVSFGGMVEIIPLMSQNVMTEPVEGLKPLTPLQLEGRDIYIREGCHVCHSQMIRPSTVRLKDGSTALSADIQLGMVVEVRSGEMVPVDGVVVKGFCHANEAAFTGESAPL